MIDWVLFLTLAAVVVTSAAAVVLSRNAVHAALFLVVCLLGVAGLFVLQQAHFLAAVQVIVYAGAIVVLFLFVIMLLGVDRREDLDIDDLKAQRPLAGLLGVVALAELLLLSRGSHWASGGTSTAGALSGPGSNVEKLARSIFTRYLLPFEVTAILLVIAVVGAVVLARRPPQGADEQPGGSTP